MEKPLHEGWLGSPVTEKQLDEGFNKQVKGLVKERNVYRILLEDCLQALNTVQRTMYFSKKERIDSDTYELAFEIEKTLKKYK